MEEGSNHVTVYVNGQASKSSGQSKTSQQQHNILKVTVTDQVQDHSPVVVVKKTVSLKTQSVIVNGVPFKSTQSTEETVVETQELEHVLDPPEPAAQREAAEEPSDVKEIIQEAIQEASPEIIEKRPASLHMEHVFNEGGSSEAGEPIDEASAVAVESEPRSHDYHPMLEEAVEDETVTVGGESVEVEYEPAAKKPREEEPETETRETIAEDSPTVVEKRPVSLHMEPVFSEKGSAEVREPIEEVSATAVESEPRSSDYHPMLEEAEEDNNVDENVDSNSVEVEYEPAGTKSKEEEIETETKETIAEESPLVVEKRPVSLHMDGVFDHKEEERQTVEEAPHEIVEKRPVSFHMEHVFSEGESDEVREPIDEASATAVESTPRFCEYHPMLEEAVDDRNVDENTAGNSVKVEYEPAATKPKEEEPETESKETVAEEAPLVVEKRPVSLHMEVAFDEQKEEERQEIEEAPHEIVEKRPVSVHMEHVFNEEESHEVREPIEEASATAVESEPRSSDYHPMLEEAEEDNNFDENVDSSSVEVEYEPSASKPQEEETETESIETIAEESPPVVEKRPVSLHMEVVFDEHKEEDRQEVDEAPHEIVEKRPVSLHMEHVFNDEGSTAVREAIEEASATAVESELRIHDYHPMLEEAGEDKTVHKSADDNSVEVEYEPAASKPNEEETETDSRETIAEDSPLVVEKRPVSLHMEAVFDDEDDRQPVEEAPHEIIEKRPVSLHVEHVFDKGESYEVQEPIEEATAVAVESEPRSHDYHPMLEEAEEDKIIDSNSVEVEYEPATNKPEEDEAETESRETIAEESPLVVEKRPLSLHMEVVFDERKEKDRQEIEEAPHEIIEKRPVSLHMEHVFSEEENNEVREPIEEASATAVESEPKSRDYHPMLEEKEEDEKVDEKPVEVEYEPAATKPKEVESETESRETIAEESPLVVEKRPVSLHMEAVFVEHKEEDRQEVEEAPHDIVEKRPVSLHMEHVFNEEGSDEVRELINEASAVAVESESRSHDYHPMLEEKEEDENIDENSVEVEYEPAATKPIEEDAEAETRESIEEESPLVVEKRPVSLHMEVVFDHKEEDRPPVEEAPHEIVEKKPVSLQVEHVFSEEGSTEVQGPIEEDSAVAVESEPKLFHYHPMLEETTEDKKVDENTVEVEYAPIGFKAEKAQEAEAQSRDAIAEESPQVVEKRPVSLHMEGVFDHEEDKAVPQDKDAVVHEVVTDVVEKKPVPVTWYGEQPEEGDDNESADKEEPPVVDVLEIPQVERKKEVEDSVQETVAPAVEKTLPEFHHELLQTVETEEQQPEDTQPETYRTEVVTTTITINQKTCEDQITQGEVVQTIYEKKTLEVTTESTSSVPDTTTTTEEALRSSSFTKLVHHRDDDEELLRRVLKKRLSAPEVLPEKENDGSAPLAASEDRGILESQEQFSSPTKTSPVPAPSGTEPYQDVPDEEKLIPDSSGKDEVGDAEKHPEESADNRPVLLLLTPDEEEETEPGKGRKKGKKGGLSSPQCKCCSLM